jgi:hypothetical protein
MSVLDELSREVEQQEASAENFARLTAVYFNALRKEGLTRAESIQLTSVWVSSILHVAQKPNGHS